MRLDLAGHMVAEVGYGHTVVLHTDAGAELRCESSYTLTTADGVSAHTAPTPGSSEYRPLDTLREQLITTATVDEHGTLTVVVANGAWLTVPADDQFESWTLADANGMKMVCLPGGELATWSA